MVNMEEIRKAVGEVEEPIMEETVEPPKKDNTPMQYSEKSISDITMADVKVKLDSDKSFVEQAEQVAEMGAVVQAVGDKAVRDEMAKSKGEQLVEKGKAKATQERSNRIKQETDEQKSKRDLYQAVLETFGIFKHFPAWLMKMIVVLLTPIYLIFLVVIGVPIGAVHFTIDCLDGLFVRYAEVDETRKPKVRAVGWILLAVGLVSSILFPLLKHFNII